MHPPKILQRFLAVISAAISGRATAISGRNFCHDFYAISAVISATILAANLATI
jgi:hypothetical protein